MPHHVAHRVGRAGGAGYRELSYAGAPAYDRSAGWPGRVTYWWVGGGRSWCVEQAAVAVRRVGVSTPPFAKPAAASTPNSKRPYTSASCAVISPVVGPFAVSEMTRSSVPPKRRGRLATTCGVKLPSRSWVPDVDGTDLGQHR